MAAGRMRSRNAASARELIGIAAADEHGGDVGFVRRQRVDRDAAVAPDGLDEPARQQRDAEPGADTAVDRLKRAEFELPRGGRAAPGEDRFEPLAVRTAGAQHHDLEIARRDQLIEVAVAAAGEDHELFAVDRDFGKVLVIDGPAHQRGFEAMLQDIGNELAGGAGAQRQVDIGIARRIGRKDGRQVQGRG